jgi:transposase-like protein
VVDRLPSSDGWRPASFAREADRLLAEGSDVDAVCRHVEVSVQIYQRWRSQFRAMRPEDVVRLKDTSTVAFR